MAQAYRWYAHGVRARAILLVGCVFATLSAFATLAGAQPPDTCPPEHVGCFAEDADWLWRDELFDTIDFDSGWVPSGSPLQLRLTFHLAGTTEIEMGGTPTVSWPPPLELVVPGRNGTGRFLIDYGLEIRAFFRFDVEVAGIRYTFEDEIDIPFIPADLRFFDEMMFDPFLLPPSAGVMLDDRTDPFELASLDLGSFVGIPGVGGGLRLDAEGELRASYRSTEIVVRDAASGTVPPILMELGTTEIPPDSAAGYGGSRDLYIHPEGVLGYEGAIVFSSTVFLDVLGVDFDFPIAEIPIDIIELMNDVIFDEVLVHVPLPDIAVSPAEIDFGAVLAGESLSMPLRIENLGEAELEVDFRPVTSFTPAVRSVDLAPSAFTNVQIVFSPAMEGPIDELLVLETNDPDAPLVMVRLLGEGVLPARMDAGPDAFMPDAGPGDAGVDASRAGVSGGGCGCRTATGGDAFAGLMLLLVFVRRRR